MAERTPYGFTAGAAEVSLAYSDDKQGTTIIVKTWAEKSVQVYVSPAGQSLRVFGGGEWKPQLIDAADLPTIREALKGVISDYESATGWYEEVEKARELLGRLP